MSIVSTIYYPDPRRSLARESARCRRSPLPRRSLLELSSESPGKELRCCTRQVGRRVDLMHCWLLATTIVGCIFFVVKDVGRDLVRSQVVSQVTPAIGGAFRSRGRRKRTAASAAT